MQISVHDIKGEKITIGSEQDNMIDSLHMFANMCKTLRLMGPKGEKQAEEIAAEVAKKMAS